MKHKIVKLRTKYVEHDVNSQSLLLKKDILEMSVPFSTLSFELYKDSQPLIVQGISLLYFESC